MFRKPFKVKCQVQIKSNEKKKMVTDVKNYFPEINVPALVSYLGDKDDIVRMKIITFSKEIIDVWLIGRVPMFFRMMDNNVTLPTVYMCWQFPQIVPRVTTNDYVMDKLKTGADLFSPGVYFETKDMLKCILDVEDPISVNTVANSAPSAVGICTMEGSRGLQSGRFARILHTVDDYLCRYHPMPRPSWNPVEMVSDDDDADAKPSLESNKPRPSSFAAAVSRGIVPVVRKTPYKNKEHSEQRVSDSDDSDSPSKSADSAAGVADAGVAIVASGAAAVVAGAAAVVAKRAVPISVDGCTARVSPSKDEYSQGDDLILYCFLKGVWDAPKSAYPMLPANFFSNFMLTSAPTGIKLNMRKSKWKKLHAFLLDMAHTGIIKIETVRPNEYRIISANKNHVMLTEFTEVDTSPIDPKPSTTIPKPATLRANIPPIVFDVGQRASNKKVTIISNLHEYAVDIPRFAKTLQQAAAASCLITEPETKGKKGSQVQVQGNQILVAAKLINDMFGIGTTHMRGLEKAPKVRR